ncbi:helix-turn-helix domain-containing protein [Nodosilinea sp. FACHB-141]|uniref:helix-turn-helix domain-containing protein n=1 Tax=Cyanophyceae TaxID=3028117 RepID=UPI0016834204|nr:helix-turn-helix transcriptional regulator [Nodosilinea sp. FACHB-141]
MFATSATRSSEKVEHFQLSDSVQKVRQCFNLSQAKLAAKIRVSLPSINRWEHGRATLLPMAVMPFEHLLHSTGEADKKLLVKYFLE